MRSLRRVFYSCKQVSGRKIARLGTAHTTALRSVHRVAKADTFASSSRLDDATSPFLFLVHRPQIPHQFLAEDCRDLISAEPSVRPSTTAFFCVTNVGLFNQTKSSQMCILGIRVNVSYPKRFTRFMRVDLWFSLTYPCTILR